MTRAVVRMLKNIGCRDVAAEVVKGHVCLSMTLPDGEQWKVRMSGSPRDEDTAPRETVRTVKRKIQGLY